MVQNNISAFCERGISFFETEVGGGLVRVSMLYNTLWGSVDTALSIAHEAATADTVIANNLIQQPEGGVAWIEDRSGIEMFNNFWVGGTPEDWRNASGPNDRAGDPELHTTPGTTAASFRLSATSPAPDGALTIDATSHDLDGIERHSADSPLGDMGALEYVDPSTASPFDALFDD